MIAGKDLANIFHLIDVAAFSGRCFDRDQGTRSCFVAEETVEREVHGMKLQLLVSKWCPTCPAAEKVWSEAAAREGLQLEVLDVGNSDGRRVVVDLGIRTVPAMVIDGKLRALGTSTISQALALLQQKVATG